MGLGVRYRLHSLERCTADHPVPRGPQGADTAAGGSPGGQGQAVVGDRGHDSLTSRERPALGLALASVLLDMSQTCSARGRIRE